MRRLARLALVTLTVSASLVPSFGCGGGGTDTETPNDHATTGGDAVYTGVLSEEAFAALHQLTPAEAPPPRGETLALPGGSSAYLSLPENATAPLPAIVVIHEWWGLNDHIRHWTDRLAEAGYAALAVDLYGGQTATDPDGAMALMRAVDADAALAVLRDAVTFLRDDPRVRASKVATIGWCFGGGWSLQAALHVEGIDAAVMYYGRPVTDPAELANFHGPLLAIFGTQDESIPGTTVDEFDAALTRAGLDHRILRYDAPHAFANPSSAHYAHEPAARAWSEVQSFLHHTLAL